MTQADGKRQRGLAKGGQLCESRREMEQFFQESMGANFLRFQRSGEGNCAVKTFVVENDQDCNIAVAAETVRLALTLPPIKKGSKAIVPEVLETRDKGFFNVSWPASSEIRVYVDTNDEGGRFWTCYSLSEADKLDKHFEQLAQHQPKLDRIWLWPAMLNRIQALGEFRGARVDFDKRQIENHTTTSESVNYLKFHIFGGPETIELLRVAEQLPNFKDRTVIAKVRLKYFENKEDGTKFSIDDVKYNGKFTARGTDFRSHESLVRNACSWYRQKVLEIEERFAISSEIAGSSYSIKGEPVYFNMSTCPIDDLNVFCEVVFSGGQPFHVWGLVEMLDLKGTSRIVRAVDMHTGSKLSFEIYPDMVVMYLYEGGCGNTVIRFFINMLRMFGATVRGEDDSETDLFHE